MATDNDLEAKLTEIGEGIRGGRITEARQALKKVARREIPRELKSRLANLFRRAGLSMNSIRVLNAIVRPADKRHNTTPATPLEICEYGAALANIGATREARALLQSVPQTQFPQAALFEGFANMSAWEYGQAVTCLRRYVSIASLTPYEKLLGELNLSASLIFERAYDEAEGILKHLIDEFSAQKHALLEANAEELLAQIHYYRADYAAAEAHLNRTVDLNSSHWVGLYARKWRAIITLARPGTRDEGITELGRIKREAEVQGQWETARDCDYRVALARGDRALLTKLYVGSPYPRYRGRIATALAELGAAPTENRGHYEWEPFAGRSPALRSVPRFSLVDATIDGRETELKVGALPHRLLQVLARDFYGPTRVAALYAELHPNAVFNPQSSPDTIHQLLRRVRDALADLPLTIVARSGAYAIAAGAPVTIELAIGEGAVAPRASSQERTLESHFGNADFNVREAQKLFGMGRRWTQQLLADQVASGRLERIGHGRSQRYRARRAA